MVGFRAVLFCGGCLALALSMGAGPAAAAEQHGKTAKQCNDELKANATAIEAAGESASAFFHACWWTTAAGQKTPIEAHPAPAAAEASGPEAAAPPAASPGRDREVAARPTRHVGAWRRHAGGHRARRVEAPATFETTPVEVAAPPVRVQQAETPLVEEVPVTVAGVPNAVVLSVLPGFKPWVRDVLNHPAVPGLTATP